uniref:hypothetical protein n=1 Tax=Clostridium sp. NkU-1 TaxID=1095009 RepID=UPI0006D1438E
MDSSETEITGIQIAGAALSIPIKITGNSATPSNAARATDSNASKASPSFAFRIFEDEEDEPEFRTAVLSVTDYNGSETEEEFRKSFGLQLQLEDRYGNKRPLSLNAPVKVWMDIPDQGKGSSSITAAFKGLDGKTRHLPVSVDYKMDRISFVLTDNGTVNLITDGTAVEEEHFLVSIDDSLEGGSITANLSEGKKGNKGDCEGRS